MSFLKNNVYVINYSRMWPFIKPYKFRACLGILLTIPEGALNAAIAGLMKPIIDKSFFDKDPGFIQLLPFLIVGFSLVQGAFSYAATYVNSWAASKVVMGLKSALYAKLLSMDTAFYDHRNSGDIMFRFSGDPDVATRGVISHLKMFLTKAFSSIGLLVVMICNSWQLTIIAIGIFALAVHPIRYVRKKIKEITQETVGASSSFLTIYNETFSGNKIISAFTLEKEFQNKFEKNQNKLFKLSIKMIQGSGWLSPVLHFIGSIGLALVIGFSMHLIFNKTIDVSSFFAFAIAMIMLYNPLKTIGHNLTKVQQSFLALDRIFEIFDTTPAIKSKEDALELDNIRESLEFKNVSFGYNPEEKVLGNISFKIEVGQTVALVGNSGGGKTTISSLIPRLYDVCEGEILIDGTNIKNYDLKSLRRNIAIVFQDNFLFSGTIRENLQLGNPEATEEDMWAALKNANLDEFIRTNDKGLDLAIGERGILLSGGQKQRVAIARAFIKNAPLVILDEATSALDNKAEKVVQQALDNLMKNRTVIVIAHRLSTIKNADNILVVNHGQIVEQGRHEELLAKGGAYYSLYSTQFASEEN